jgi:hypothetical protein
MKYIYVFVLFQAIFLFGGCQTNEKTNQIKAKPLFVTYEVRYLEQEKELRALAFFKEGDSLEVAVQKEFSNITFQSNLMEKQNLGERGTRFILNKKGPFSANLDFSYKNDEGIPINYDLTMPAISEIAIKEGNVDKNKGATVVWKGEALDPSQSLIFMFSDKNNKAQSTTVKGPTELAEVFIPSKDLKGLTLGNGQLYLVKKQIQKTQEDNQTILSVVEYYTSPVDINVVD